MTVAPRLSLGRMRPGTHRVLWRLAGPLILSNLTTPLLTAVDTAVVGHLEAPFYLGAVALAGVIFNFIFWGFGFLRMGTTGLAAQAFGAADGLELRAILARALAVAAGLALLVIAAQDAILWVAYRFLAASEEVRIHGAVYFGIRVWSAPAVLANYALLGWFLGLQNARAALLLTLWLNGVNILFDLVFVVLLGLDVDGVAAATIVAEYSAFLLGLGIVRRELARLPIPGDPGGALMARIREPREIRRLVVVNGDIFIRTLCLIFGFSFFTAWGARLGDVVLAANAVLLNFETIMAMGLDGYAHAVEALVGKAKGARDLASLRSAVAAGFLWAGATAVVIAVVYWAAGGLLIDVLTGLDGVRASARDYRIWVVIAPMIAVWAYLLDGIFIGATRTADMRNCMMLSLAIYLAAAFLLVPVFGNGGLWASLTVFWAIRGITLGARYPALEREVARIGGDDIVRVSPTVR